MSNTTAPTISMERVTPAIAEKWLAKNTHNRKINSRVVDAMVRDLESGNWMENGSTITFSSDGVLLDGQHRLTAVSESGVSINVIVVRGIATSAQHTMDTGAKRTLANALQLRGETSYVALSASVTANFSWDLGVRRFGTQRGQKITNGEALDYLDANPWLRDQLPDVVRYSSKLPHVGTGTVSVLYREFSDIDPFDADYFFERLTSDEDHHRGEPIYAARKLLMEDAARDTHRSQTWKAAILIKAWNKYRDGEQVMVLSFSPGGARPQKFPIPH